MKKLIVFLVAILATGIAVHAQSKVIQEVSDDISSESKTIFSGRSVIGYVLFSQLEKASEDSFNYKLTIMDENLNDIGIVNFREIGLDLEAISFEEDVLCLAYLKSSEFGKTYNRYKSVKNKSSKDFVMTQFINLEGEILKTQNISVTTSGEFNIGGRSKKRTFNYQTQLKHGIQLESMPGKGFVLFYGDDNKSKAIAYNFEGNQLWSTTVPQAEGYYMHQAADNIYLLLKENNNTYGDFKFTNIDTETGKLGKMKRLEDKEGNQLRVLSFETDPASGNLFIAGNILRKNKIDPRVKTLAKGTHAGVFTIDIDSTAKKGMREKYLYWNDGSQQPQINKTGYSTSDKSYLQVNNAYRDYAGNTYFVSDALKKKPRIGGIVSSVVLAPTIVYPLFQANIGFNFYTLNNTNVYKLSPKGAFSLDAELDMHKTHKAAGKAPINYLTDLRKNYYLTSDENKTTYLVASDDKNTVVYNTLKHKVIRTVPDKKDGSKLMIGPAKEGYIMVMEYNKREKYTRLSIEKLD